MNVVCIHCDNGRDRTGMMVSAWLLQTKRCLTASHAITFFASVRGGISPCVTIPSQRRYPFLVNLVCVEVYFLFFFYCLFMFVYVCFEIQSDGR